MCPVLTPRGLASLTGGAGGVLRVSIASVTGGDGGVLVVLVSMRIYC